jgi:hypothetical protein
LFQYFHKFLFLPILLQVLMLQWMGASGHFALGNSNTLATVDVAGAYIVLF